MIDLAVSVGLFSSGILIVAATIGYYLLYKKNEYPFKFKTTVPEEAFLWTIGLKANKSNTWSLRVLVLVLIVMLTVFYGNYGFFASLLAIMFVYFAYYPLEFLKDYVQANGYEYNFISSIKNYLKHNNTGRYHEDLTQGILEYAYIFNDHGIKSWIKNKNKTPEGTQGKIAIYEDLESLNYDSADLYLETNSKEELNQVAQINRFVQKIHLRQILLAIMASMLILVIVTLAPLHNFYVFLAGILSLAFYFFITFIANKSMTNESKGI